MTAWSDDTFVGINNEGGDYNTYQAFGSDVWTDAAPGIKEAFGFGAVHSIRHDNATGANQYVKLQVPNLADRWRLSVRCGTGAGTEFPGYCVLQRGPYLYWYSEGDNRFTDLSKPGLTGAGTIELNVTGHVCTLVANGVAYATYDFTAAPRTGTRQGFGSEENCAVLYAEGGDIGAAATVPDQVPGMSATSVTKTRIDLAWSAPANGGSPITGYKIERAPDATGAPGTWSTLLATTGSPSPRTYSDLTVTNGQRWWYRVSAINSVGAGTPSVPDDATAVDPPPPAFSDDFTSGLRMWTVARWRSEGSQSGNPGFVTTSSNDDGHYDGVLGTHTTPTGPGLVPPYDIFVGTNDWLYVGGGSQNYGDTFLRCAQRMDLTGAGPWIMRCGFVPNINSGGLFGWTTIFATDEPQPSPSMTGENSNGPIPKNGFSIRLDDGEVFNSAASTYHPVPTCWTYNNFVEDGVSDAGHPIFDLSMTNSVDVVITFSRTHIRITAGGELWFDQNWTLPATLTSCWMYLGAHNHATRKYGEFDDSRSAIFTYFNFDGAVILPQYSYAVPDALVPYNGTGEEGGGPGMNVGWHSPTGPLTIPNVPANVSAAKLLMSSHWVLGQPNENNYYVRYSLNGNATHDVQTMFKCTSGSYAYSVPINPAELVIGNNTVAITLIGQVGSFPPYVGNISLLVESFSVGKALLGTIPASALRVGNTAVRSLALGSTEIWRAPLPPQAPTAPTLIILTRASGQLAARWSLPVNNGSPLTDYIIQRRTSPAGAWTTFTHTTGWARTVAITGLTNGTAYDVRIAAINSVGTGGWSNIITATPL